MAEKKAKTRTRKSRVKPKLEDVVAKQQVSEEIVLTSDMTEEPKVEKPKKAVKKAPKKPQPLKAPFVDSLHNRIVCHKCNTSNSIRYTQCKRCGQKF